MLLWNDNPKPSKQADNFSILPSTLSRLVWDYVFIHFPIWFYNLSFVSEFMFGAKIKRLQETFSSLFVHLSDAPRTVYLTPKLPGASSPWESHKYDFMHGNVWRP